MPKRESDAVTEAMRATDQELFASALGGETAVHDDTGDRSLEAQDDSLEGKVEDLDEGTEAKTEGDERPEVEAKPEDGGPEKDPKTGKFVAKTEGDEPQKGEPPAGRLREATAKAKAAEAREADLKIQLDAEKQERQALNAKFDLLLQQQAARDRPVAEPKKPEALVKPDKFLDPDGHDKWIEDRIAAATAEAKREITETREDYTKRLVNMNLAATHEVHKEKFEAAYQAILSDAPNNPETRVAIQRIWASDNPGGELMRWHRDRETLKEVNGDPAAYRQKIADETRAALLADPEFRKEMIAAIKGDTRGPTAARHITRLPKSLNGAPGTAHLADASFEDSSDEAFFERAVNPGG